MSDPTAAPIPEERVAAILARAAELDRERKETITVNALRAAALDAGISPAAMDAALAEYADGQVLAGARQPEPGSPRFGRARALLRKAWGVLRTPVRLGAAFFVIGVAGAAGEGAVIIAWAAWLLMAARLILKHRRGRRATPFILALVYMTFGLVFGFAITEAVDEDAIFSLLPVGAVLLLAGTLAIKVRLPRRAGRTELEAQTG